MRIVFITPSLKQGGYEKVVISYANELSARGYDVDILCGFQKGELLNSVRSTVRLFDFKARARSFVFPLMQYLRVYQPDILYCGFREYNCIGVLAKRMTGAKVCVYASQHGFQRGNKIVQYLQGRAIRHADCLLAVADAIADYEADALHLDRDRFVITNNPVFDSREDVHKEFHPWFEPDEYIPIIIICGRLAEGKGIEYSLKIVSEINSSMNVRLLILGDGPLMEELKSEVKALKIEHLVDFLGYVENPMGYMAQCSLFLHTALEEGFGNVVVEAMQVGLIPCVTNCTGPMQIIEDGKYGVDLGSVQDECFVQNAAKKIIDVLNGKVAFSYLEERAACYDIQAATDQFLSIYKNGVKG